MKLLTPTISAALQKQWPQGGDLRNTRVLVKLFNPSGAGTWYIISQDPKDLDTLYGIVDLFEVETGTISLSELEKLRTKPFGLGIERDLSFQKKNAQEILDGLADGQHFADGGEVKVHIVNKGKKFDNKVFDIITGDMDGDGIKNADDPHPQKPGDKETIDPEISFADTFKYLIKERKDLNTTMQKVVGKLKKNAPYNSDIYARTKTPYSILKKMVEKKFVDPRNPKKGLTDYIGTTVTFDDYHDLEGFRKEVIAGKLGKVYEEEDLYAAPKAGYRAYHYLIYAPDGKHIFELQLKTKRQKALNELSHPLYKHNNVNIHNQEQLTGLADKADRGDSEAAKKIDELLKKPEQLQESLAKDADLLPTFAKGGELNGIENIFVVPEAGEDITEEIIDSTI